MNAHTVGVGSAPAPTAPNVAVGIEAHAIGEARREVSELLATGATGACASDVEYRDIGWIGATGRACIDGSHHSHTYALGGSVAPEDLAAPARMRSLGPQYCSFKNVLTNFLCRRCRYCSRIMNRETLVTAPTCHPEQREGSAVTVAKADPSRSLPSSAAKGSG